MDAQMPSEAASSVEAPLQVRLDPSFGTGGNVGGDLSYWTPAGVAVDALGRLIVSGPSRSPTAPPGETVLRLMPDGSVDGTFGSSNGASIIVDSEAWPQVVTPLPGGTIGVLGAALIDGGGGAFAFQLDPGGSLDTSFDGPLVTTLAGTFSSGAWQSDGSGFIFGTGAVVRFDSSGTLETSYGDGGELPPAATGALASDGTLWTGAGSIVSRYLPTGAVDPTFGSAGAMDLAGLDGGLDPWVIQSLVLQSSGSAVVVGSHVDDGSYAVDFAQLTASGDLDTTYAVGGFASVQSTGGPVGAGALADGRILVWSSYGELLAVTAEGQMAGMWNLPASGTPLAATLDSSQRLVVTGMNTSDPMNQKWFINRYLLF